MIGYIQKTLKGTTVWPNRQIKKTNKDNKEFVLCSSFPPSIYAVVRFWLPAYWHGLEQKQLTDRRYFYQNQKDKREQNIGGAKMRGLYPGVRQIWGEATL